MKRIALLLTLALAVLAAAARTYAPADVPNVHVADRTRNLVNPDGIISPAAQTQVDSIVAQLRRATSAEMSVVVLDDIKDPDNIDEFATELFGLWGLGKTDRDNGVLILVAKDRRKAVIRTGYGAEGVLPDIVCGTILREQMFPAFREGDFDRGVVNAVGMAAGLMADPDAAAELQSRLRDADSRSGAGVDMFSLYVRVSLVAALLMIIALAARLWSIRRRTSHEKYMAMAAWKPGYLIGGFATLGMGLVPAIWLVLLMEHWRNGRRACPNCGGPMKKIDEVHDNDYLTPAQDLEERVGSVDYDVWLCPKCGETDILPYVNRSSTLKECENCHARTARLSADRTLRRPTTSAEGMGMREYTCMNCRHITRRPYRIAKLAPVVIVPAAGLGSGKGGGFGGGGFGGGFGGGMTGGGGASGGW